MIALSRALLEALAMKLLTLLQDAHLGDSVSMQLRAPQVTHQDREDQTASQIQLHLQMKRLVWAGIALPYQQTALPL